MEFSELARSLCQLQLSESWRSFSNREKSIVEDCASRGWWSLGGADYVKINDLGRNVLKEISEKIWSCLVESYDASQKKPNEEELRKFFEDRISQEAHSISETIIARIEQQYINQRHPRPSFERRKEDARRKIETERDHLIYLLTGRLNIFLGKLHQKPKSPLIFKPSFFGVGIDFGKLGPWLKRFRRSKS